MSHAKMQGISAIRADFLEADLSGSDLTNGDFRSSRLQQAHLDNAITNDIKTKGALLVDGTVGK